MQSSSLKVQIDDQTPKTWSGVTQEFCDASIYQTWSYGAVCWGSGNLSHVVIRRDGKLVAAAQLRIARLPMISAGIAYLRWPMMEPRGELFDVDMVRELISCLRQEYVQRRGLTLQIIPRVFKEQLHSQAVFSMIAQCGMVEEPALSNYRTIVVDLSLTEEELRKQLNSKWRNQLNRSEKNNLCLEVSDSIDAYREFLPLYTEMWKRKKFKSSVSVEEFGEIQDLLIGTDRMQTFLARSNGKVVAALVCSLLGDKAIYLLGATNEQARELKAAYFLQWRAMLWLKEHEAVEYDLGGVDLVNNPGGHHFKAGFGGREVTQLATYGIRGNLLSTGIAAIAKWKRRAFLSSTRYSRSAVVDA